MAKWRVKFWSKIPSGQFSNQYRDYYADAPTGKGAVIKVRKKHDLKSKWWRLVSTTKQ